jgi:ribosomal protein L29
MDGLGDDDGMGFDMKSMMMNQQSQLYGNYSNDGQVAGMSGGSMYDDSALGAGEETNDAKRRRIARVRTTHSLYMCISHVNKASWAIGLRHVPEEEDQVRRQDAQVLTLHQL